MTGGGYIVALGRQVHERAARVLKELGARTTADGDVLQFADGDGRLFTLDGLIAPGTEIDVYEGPFIAGPDVDPPSMRDVFACPFTCRWG